MYSFLKKIMLAICQYSLRCPYRILAVIALITIPAVLEVQKIFIDPNLVRLLPTNSRASKNTRTFSAITGDGGYFTMILTSDESNTLVQAADEAARQIRPLKGVYTVEYEWPVEFFRQYRYHLIPNDYLEQIYDKILGWKSELSPAGVNLLGGDTADPDDTEVNVQSPGEEAIEGDIRQFASLSPYHFSADGKNLGIIIRTSNGIDEFQEVVDLYKGLTNVAAGIAKEFPVEIGIAGSHRNKTDEFNLINDDIGHATLISGCLILLVTALGFRSIRTALVVLIPLIVGMAWGFAFIPSTIRSLNLITAFLIIILTGMGIDYAIHLVKRVEQEMFEKPFAEALASAYRNTGPSVLVSGFTTAFALSILSVSSFRGFSEFGIISAMVLACILASMVVCMPPMLVVAHRFGFIRARDHRSEKAIVLSRRWTLMALGLMGICLIIGASGLQFDASFRNLEFDRSAIAGLHETDAARNARDSRMAHNKVYSSTFSPGAIFLADDTENLDRLLEIFDKRIHENTWLTDPVTNMVHGAPVVSYTTNTTTIERARSLRDYTPDPNGKLWHERRALLRDVQEEMREGVWIDRIENPDRKRWIREMRDWNGELNPLPPAFSELPEIICTPLLSKDGAARYLVAVFPSVDRKVAAHSLRFTDEIYQLVPESQAERERLGIGGVWGPVGEVPVFAEIVRIVKGEIWWVVSLTFIGIFILVWLELKTVRESLFVMIPLISGLVFTFGAMVLLSMNLNLFNVIMIPALLGMGVDNGVHMFTRWKEYHGHTMKAASELFIPLFLCTFTTMLGYAGMIIAAHPGLRSIGTLAVLGMMMLWLTSVIILPAMLEHFMRRKFLSAAEVKILDEEEAAARK
ncbi:MAG: MMPL family transporter [Spirochaetota bacterium]|jgi:predicted RND superfamily exporter protein|nr:MMPL family transporter [Spirochaetota bacterium]